MTNHKTKNITSLLKSIRIHDRSTPGLAKIRKDGAKLYTEGSFYFKEL